MTDRLLKLMHPGLAGAEIVLVEPDPKPGGQRIGCRQKSRLQGAGGIGIDAAVAEKQQRRVHGSASQMATASPLPTSTIVRGFHNGQRGLGSLGYGRTAIP